MTTLSVHTIPSPVLRRKAEPVGRVDARIGRFMDDMLIAMYAKRGIGLAANQVGLLERVITLDLSEERDGYKALLMANPVITWKSDDVFVYNEGCLSVPEQHADITRPKRIRLTYLDQSGIARELEAEDLLSQCIQHEIDHLNGVLFIDYLSPLKRKMITRKVEKSLQKTSDTRLD